MFFSWYYRAMKITVMPVRNNLFFVRTIFFHKPKIYCPFFTSPIRHNYYLIYGFFYVYSLSIFYLGCLLLPGKCPCLYDWTDFLAPHHSRNFLLTPDIPLKASRMTGSSRKHRTPRVHSTSHFLVFRGLLSIQSRILGTYWVLVSFFV